MKNVQIIDGALNCTYDVYAIDDADFALVFPDSQDIEFASDLEGRLGRKLSKDVFTRFWLNRLEKSAVNGIHGTLFYELDFKKAYYPTKKEAEMVFP